MSDLATITPDAPPSLANLSSAERANWRLTGDLPSSVSVATDTTSSTEADSSPAAPDAQATSTDVTAPPASEPGTPKKKANAETRKSDLQAEIEALVTRRNALQAEVASPMAARPSQVSDVRAESSPAPESLSQFIARPDVNRPALDEGEFFDKFPEAKLQDFTRYTARYEVGTAQREQSRASTINGRKQAYADVIKQEFPESDAFWAEKVQPIAVQLVPVDLMPEGMKPSTLNYLSQEIYTSPQAGKILRHLADHPEILQRMQAGTIRDAIRTVAQLEASVSSSSVPTQPVVKTTTSAPDLPETLGRKPSAPTDDVAAAIASGDVRRYMAAQNRRELAS